MFDLQFVYQICYIHLMRWLSVEGNNCELAHCGDQHNFHSEHILPGKSPLHGSYDLIMLIRV